MNQPTTYPNDQTLLVDLTLLLTDKHNKTMSTPAAPKEGIEFDALPWNLNLPDEISYLHLTTNNEWGKEHYDPDTDKGLVLTSVYKYSDRPLPLYPSTTSLNYGTTIWEGLKCYRRKDGSPVVFRPDRNYHRFVRGAEQMCLPKPSFELFMRGIQQIIQHQSQMIPPNGDGMKLYVRPMLMGSGQQLGLYPSPEFSLLFYVSPTVRGSEENYMCDLKQRFVLACKKLLFRILNIDSKFYAYPFPGCNNFMFSCWGRAGQLL